MCCAYRRTLILRTGRLAQGWVKFSVLNLRVPVVFRLMRGRGPAAQELAVSNSISFRNLLGEPTNAHISIHKTHSASRQAGQGAGVDGSAVAVHWNTGRLSPDRAAAQTVQFGLVPGQLSMLVSLLSCSLCSLSLFALLLSACALAPRARVPWMRLPHALAYTIAY